jgi:hypothetical protein
LFLLDFLCSDFLGFCLHRKIASHLGLAAALAVIANDMTRPTIGHGSIGAITIARTIYFSRLGPFH